MSETSIYGIIGVECMHVVDDFRPVIPMDGFLSEFTFNDNRFGLIKALPVFIFRFTPACLAVNLLAGCHISDQQYQFFTRVSSIVPLSIIARIIFKTSSFD